MSYNGARIIVEALKKEGVDTVFAYTGGAVISIFDELYRYGKGIRLVQTRHEQAGTHAADGYARATGKPGVVLVTSGPGSTNTITGIATAYMDSVPMVILTGQVSTEMIGSDAFQEVDTTGMTQAITKANFLVTDIEQLAMTMKKAFHLATSGRKGPVLVDIPSDLQRASTDFLYPERVDISGYHPSETDHPKLTARFLSEIQRAKKPLILSGGGVLRARAAELVNRFSRCWGIPVVTTLQGHGIYPNGDLYLSGIGMHGTVYGNYAMQQTDLLIALGVRFSDRITGKRETFCPKARIVQVDIDPAEIDKNVPVDIPIVGDLHQVLTEWLNVTPSGTDFGDWRGDLNEKRMQFPLAYHDGGKIKPQYLIELLNRYFDEDTIVVADVGQNQMWTAQYYRFKRPDTFLTSGGLGTMGYALPAGIGAKIGHPNREVLVIAGDGGFQMNIQELFTITQYGLKIKILILDNGSLGMVRQWQQLFFQGRYAGTILDNNPSFEKLAAAVGIRAATLKSGDGCESGIRMLWESSEAMLIHAHVSPEELVLPMVPAGGQIDQPISMLKGD